MSRKISRETYFEVECGSGGHDVDGISGQPDLHSGYGFCNIQNLVHTQVDAFYL
ncbi:MAG: hypothetical protein LBK65_06760 [Tannerellaceae bacterium]|jgi:hypothetical protein|nr:hypothetical protein [Tannerellaceae bacterium]